MTIHEFSEMFAALALQMRQQDADEAMIRAYYAVLQDVDGNLLKLAADQFARTAEWFPKTSEWREAAFQIEHARTETLKERLRDLPAPLCAICSDTGWSLDQDTNRVSRCACAKTRRQEIIGMRPLPPARKILRS